MNVFRNCLLHDSGNTSCICLCIQETDGLRQRIASSESKATELSAKEQQLRQQESVEVSDRHLARSRPRPLSGGGPLIDASRSCTQVPRARHTISLYANISSIRWDYSAASVKGWVTSASGKGMKAFEM